MVVKFIQGGGCIVVVVLKAVIGLDQGVFAK
jgi:hypothetical protein